MSLRQFHDDSPILSDIFPNNRLVWGDHIPVPSARKRSFLKISHGPKVTSNASTAASRQRRHRARRKQGRFVVPIEVTCEMITALVDQGDVDDANSSDVDCVGKAITAAARRGLDLT